MSCMLGYDTCTRIPHSASFNHRLSVIFDGGISQQAYKCVLGAAQNSTLNCRTVYSIAIIQVCSWRGLELHFFTWRGVELLGASKAQDKAKDKAEGKAKGNKSVGLLRFE